MYARFNEHALGPGERQVHSEAHQKRLSRGARATPVYRSQVVAATRQSRFFSIFADTQVFFSPPHPKPIRKLSIRNYIFQIVFLIR